MTRSFDVFFGLCLNKRLSKQLRRRWFETPSRSFWRHCNGYHWRTRHIDDKVHDGFNIVIFVSDGLFSFIFNGPTIHIWINGIFVQNSGSLIGHARFPRTPNVFGYFYIGQKYQFRFIWYLAHRRSVNGLYEKIAGECIWTSMAMEALTAWVMQW